MRVCAIVPVWNQQEFLPRCLDGLMESGVWLQGVAVVDNGSVGGILPAALSSHRPVVLTLDVNRGFAGGCNVGIRWALQQGADAVLILNSDAWPGAGALAALIDTLHQHPRVAACGPKVLTDESPPRINCAFGTVNYRSHLVDVAGWLEPEVDRYAEEHDVDAIFGTALLMRSAALEEVGLLDEDFFAYHEDVEWCTRARRAGWTVRYVPRATAFHRRHSSISTARPGAMTYLCARSGALFVARHASVLNRSRFYAFSLCRVVVDMASGRSSWRDRILGLRDGGLGRTPDLSRFGLDARGTVAQQQVADGRLS